MNEKQVINDDNPRYAGNGQTKAELTARLPKPGPGRGKESEEKKLIRKAVKELVQEYKESLANALPQISPILIELALKKDLGAIKELNDILVDKAPRKIIGDPESPLIIQISQEAAKKYQNDSTQNPI